MTGNRFGKNREDRPVLKIAGQKHCGRQNGKHAQKDRHRTQGDILEHLELLLKREFCKKGGVPNHDQPEKKDKVEDFLADEFREGVPSDGKNAYRGEEERVHLREEGFFTGKRVPTSFPLTAPAMLPFRRPWAMTVSIPAATADWTA